MGADASFAVFASVLTAWIAPAILFVVVLAMGYAGVRWMGSQQMASVRAVPLFSGLSTRQLRSILRSAREMEFPPGAKIVSEGDAGRSFYLIRRGRATVNVGGVESGALEPNSYLGESRCSTAGRAPAPSSRRRRSARSRSRPRASTVLLEADPSIAPAIGERMTEWLRASGDDGDGARRDAIDRATLAAMAERLRAARHQDWGGPPGRGRTSTER
jgi:CRP-like cAMP-binding protein